MKKLIERRVNPDLLKLNQSQKRVLMKTIAAGDPKRAAEDIAAAAIALYSDKSAWTAAQNQIAPILKERYEAESLGKALIKRMESVKNNLEQHRLDNFTGGMLNHHLAKSTQYMSKWIEVKTELQRRKE